MKSTKKFVVPRLTTNMGRIGGFEETGLQKHLNYLIPSW
jgi:hypothetical protein